MTEAAGYYAGLRRGFEDIGIPTLFIDDSAHPFGYVAPDMLGRTSRLVDRVRRRRMVGSSLIARTFWRMPEIATRAARFGIKLALFIRALLTCDAFIFGGGETFFRRRDLTLLRLLRKRVVVVFVGSDHRPPYLNGRWVRSMPDRESEALVEDIRTVHDRVRAAEQFADVIVASGASAQFHRRPFVQILAVGTPSRFPSAPVDPKPDPCFRGRGVRILHSPSNPASKGSDLVRAAVAAVRAGGHEIDYVELSGRPHSDVLDCLRECDMVVDEVFSDAPMAMFAAEAAFFAKPALVTGYYAEMVPIEMAAELVPPTLFSMPDRLQHDLFRLVSDEDFRLNLGQRAQAFLRTHWEPGQVALRYLRILRGDIPAAWLVDPAKIQYLRGYGMPIEVRDEGIRRIVGEAGIDALCLGDKPVLERRLQDETEQSS
jgi:hypothetical protein